MFRWLGILGAIFLLYRCGDKTPVVESIFIDSLLANYSLPHFARAVDEDVLFWKQRVLKEPDNFLAKEKYAVGLIEKFQIFSDVRDVKSADSVLNILIRTNKADSAGLMLMLAKVKMLQHQFYQAAGLIEKVRNTGTEKYATAMLQFDSDFELGNYSAAKVALLTNKQNEDYGYNFRVSKLHHYEGSADSAIAQMLKAENLSQKTELKTAALSNAGDLYLHSSKVEEAYKLYKASVQNNAADFHSLGKIGWIALVHDKNTAQAIRIFKFLQSQIKSPYPLLLLSYSYELSNHTIAKTFAEKFIKEVAFEMYGDMYNKYIIELYAGILNQPAKAVAVAKRELQQRKTPQTYAWLAYALSLSQKNDEALQFFKEYVSGKPLEGYELFLMGRLMENAGKKLNASQFYKEAEKNKYDLTPVMIRHLEEFLQ